MWSLGRLANLVPYRLYLGSPSSSYHPPHMPDVFRRCWGCVAGHDRAEDDKIGTARLTGIDDCLSLLDLQGAGGD